MNKKRTHEKKKSTVNLVGLGDENTNVKGWKNPLSVWMCFCRFEMSNHKSIFFPRLLFFSVLLLLFFTFPATQIIQLHLSTDSMKLIHINFFFLISRVFNWFMTFITNQREREKESSYSIVNLLLLLLSF